MAAIVAGTGAVFALFGGAAASALSRPGGVLGSKHHQHQHDLVARLSQDPAQLDDLARQTAKQTAAEYQPPFRISSTPLDAAERQPSVLDVMEGKWFGSVSSDASVRSGRFHDSAESMSPPERQRRLLDVVHTSSASGAAPSSKTTAAAGHATSNGYHPRGERDSAGGAAAVQPKTVGRRSGSTSSGSHSSHGSVSASRQIAQSISNYRRPQPLPPPPEAELSEPQTPEWTDASVNLSTLRSEMLLAASDNGTPLLGTSADDEAQLAAGEQQHGSSRAAAVAAGSDSRQHASSDAGRHSTPAPAELFGTWARRQRHFQTAAEAAERADSSGADDAAPATHVTPRGDGDGSNRKTRKEPPQQLEEAPHRQARQAAKAQRAAMDAELGADDEDRVRDAAWRWRFGRRWAAEQAKQFDPDYGKNAGDEEDGWDEALGYLGACGTGINLQIGRTVSVDKGLGKTSLHRDGSVSFMLDGDDSQHDEGPLARASTDYEATRGIGAVAKKAQELLRRQREIDRDVAQQWGDTRAAGVSWAGQFLPAVGIDMYGRFAFVLLRATDITGAQKLLVRGRAGSSHDQLLQAAKREAAQQAMKRQVPGANLETIGTGVMEWSSERDRCLNVCEGRVVKRGGSNSTVQSDADAARLAGALTSCSLPLNHRVTVDGLRLM